MISPPAGGRPPAPSRRRTPILLALLLLVGGSFGYLAWISRAPVRDLMPGGAVLLAELRGAEELIEGLEDTAFAREFARSRTAAWLGRTGAVAAFDGARAELRRITGLQISRRHLLDLLGRETVVAWYPVTGPAGAPALRWVAGCRLSLRAWCIRTLLGLAARFDIGDAPLRRELIAGTETLCFAGDQPGDQYHAFTRGRLLVVGNDRELVARAAGCAARSEAPVTREAAWTAVRSPLPREGDLFLFAHTAAAPPGLFPVGSVLPSPAGLLLQAGRTTTISIFAPRGAGGKGNAAETAADAPFPGLELRAQEPLLLHSSRGKTPPLLGDLLAARAEAVDRRDGVARGALPALGGGFAIVVTDATGDGPFPRPRGVVMAGMESPAAAAEALRRLFPRTARSAAVRGLQAFTTRESLPLAGAYDLWGAAVGRHLVFATDTVLLEGLPPGGGSLAEGPDDPAAALGAAWHVDAISSLSMAKALPVLRRYAPPFSGWLQARFRGAPDAGRDVGLLRVVRSVAVVAGSGPEGSLTRISLALRDLEPAAGVPRPLLP